MKEVLEMLWLLREQFYIAVVGMGEPSEEQGVTVGCCWQEGWTDGRRAGQPAKAPTDFSPSASPTWPNSLPNDASCFPLVLCAQLMHFGRKAGNFHSLVMTWEI